MDDNIKSEKWTLEDGRRAVRKVTENTVDGQGERVIEIHVEDERPLRLQQRVVEKSKPIVFERKIETIDGNGNVVESKVESIEPKVQMQLVEHIAAVNNDMQVTAQSVVENDCDCHVTKEEMIEAIVTAVKSMNAVKPEVKEAAKPIANFSNQLQSLGLADEIAGRSKNNISTFDVALIVSAVVVLGALVYLAFF